MRFGIRSKLLLLIAALSLALIAVSVLVSSRLYSESLEANEKKLCAETADSLVESIETLHIDFVKGYRAKIEAIYSEHREELEEAAQTEFESFDKREEFYEAVTEGVFPPRHGLGLSYEMAAFNNEYASLRSEMDMLSFAGGLDIASLFFYDPEYGNMVYLIDRMPEGSELYSFPASVAKPAYRQLETALENCTSAEFIEGAQCYGVKPVSDTDGVFVLFGKLNAGIRQNVRLFSLYTLAILLGATLIIGLFILLFANGLIVKNVKKLTSASERFTSQIGGGIPERVNAEVNSGDEIGDLADKFALMQDTILGYIQSLAEKTSREEKMKAELELAARIQSESLPKGGICRGSAELASFLKPAREVGGDLYDYFMLDETRLFFCLADVSGKGVPASLFMMRAKELIRAHVISDATLGELGEKLNCELCRGNEESIFITAFFGVLDTETGLLSYLRAGHEQPMLLRRGAVSAIGDESNFVLGVFEDAAFVSEEIMLEPGDVLLMYTDGLSEGINEAEEAFGYDRIGAVLKAADNDVTGAMYRALCDFCGKAEQFDDVTMLALSLVKSKRIELESPDYQDIPRVTEAVLGELKGFDRSRVSEVGILIDEIMNNQLSYAFKGTERPRINVGFELHGSTAVLAFEDNGTPFDPLSEVTEADIERSEGGLGLVLVRELSDSVSYRHEGCLNVLTVKKQMCR